MDWVGSKKILLGLVGFKLDQVETGLGKVAMFLKNMAGSEFLLEKISTKTNAKACAKTCKMYKNEQKCARAQ